LDGTVGKVKVALRGEGKVEPQEWRVGDVQLDGKLAAGDGKALAAMLGLSHYVAVGGGPGSFTLKAHGPATGQWHVDGALAAKGLDVTATGTAEPFSDDPTVSLQTHVARADASPLRGTGGGSGALPVSFTGGVALADNKLKLSRIDATVAGSNVRGSLDMSLSAPHRLDGALEADNLDGAALIAAAIGMPPSPPAKNQAWTWSGAPFGPGAFGDYAGSISLKVQRLALLPRLTVRQFSGTLHAGKNEFALRDMSGMLAGGTLGGALSFKSGDDGLSTAAKLSLAHVESATLLSSAARPPVAGALAAAIDLEGSGLSPVALMGALHGSGKVALSHAVFAGLDPHAFDAVTAVVDAGIPVKGDELADVVRKALASGQLTFDHADGKLAVNAGLVRLSDFNASSDDADLSLSSTLDLTDGDMDARLVLSGSKKNGRPDIFMALRGPANAPERTVDVSALTGWLTLRSVENQARRLKTLQEEQKQAAPVTATQEPAKTAPAPENKGSDAPADSAPAHETPTSALATEPAKPETPSPSEEVSKKPPAKKLTPSRARLDPPRPVRQKAPAVHHHHASPRLAPALPAPIDIHPLPVPKEIVAPEASAGPQH
ncbi:MAG TPA: AsmA-like C-terminal region-containing protein, partial [Pseudolabrys sp.]|nr:AsmA-like C-terminal region-containing protein [Pseudolabrys sp.]